MANPSRHRIAARLRFLLNLKVYGWAARGALKRWPEQLTAHEQVVEAQ